MKYPFLPSPQGLYHPKNEHDGCGIGFVAHIGGAASHGIVEQALEVLCNLDHRGARGCEVNTGDGAGILTQIPDRFFRHELSRQGVELPERGRYGVAMLFLPPDEARRRACEQRLEEIAAEEGQAVLGWRDVPTGEADLGDTARSCEPCIRQLFIGAGSGLTGELDFERKLYVIGKRASHEIRHGGRWPGSEYFYFQSISCRTIVYKGMLTPGQVENYYTDLSDPLLESAIVLVHSRFSTNTFPSWERAHPYRYLIHNGEINTLRGNENWMHTRQSMLRSRLFGDDLEKLFPVIEEDGSDSAKFDNCLEFLHLAGRSLGHAVMMMIPEPWEKHESMSDEKKAFYEYHACLMEPWDGPASIAFTDGTQVGAVLDRNGLRPSRYYVTADDRVIMGSEVGVLDVEPENVLHKGRLQPGRMFLVDTAEGRIIADEELKQRWATEHPYRQWLDEHLVDFQDLPGVEYREPAREHEEVLRRQQVFGFTFEDLRVNLIPMARNAIWPIGSMGNDAALAVLSDRPQPLFSYFKQLFAQVTNPPIDPIREELVTATETTLGSERNFLEPEPESCRQLRLTRPVLTNAEMAKLKGVDRPGMKPCELPILFPAEAGEEGMRQALDELFAAAEAAIDAGATILILSDRGFDERMAPIPALLAVSGLHHHLIRAGKRTRAGLAVESGEPREVHHFCLLLGYGANAINPYMVYESLGDLIREGMLTDLGFEEANDNYNKAVVKGIVKVMSKMGISTFKSYRGAQIFEAVGIRQEVIDRYFTWTDSRVEGIGLDVIAEEACMRHGAAYPQFESNGRALDAGGEYQWRKGGEYHLFNPQTVHKLQKAARENDYAVFKEYSALIDDRAKSMATLRSLLEFRFAGEPLPLDEVEPVEAITRRFKSGAMSYGSISKEAHEGLAVAMNRIGGKSNTGEGGEDPARYVLDPNGDSRNSAIKQVASGRFGVTSNYLVHAPGAADQDGPGGQAGRRGRAARRQGLPLDSQGQAVDPGSRPDLAAAAPRHLLDRGPGGADPRPQELEPRGAHQRQAGLRGGRRHDRRRGGKRPRRRRPDQRPRRRHRGLAADEHQARRPPMGAGPRRHAPDARAQRPAQPHRRRDRRPAQDRARRGGRRPAGGRGVRFRDHRPGRHGLHHDAGLPPRHLSRGGGDPEPGAAREVLRNPRSRGQLPALRRPGAARDHGRPRIPHRRRDGGAHRQADPGAQRSLEGQGRRPVEDPPHAGGARQRRPLLPDRPGPRPGALPRRGGSAGALRAGDRPRGEGPGRAADPEHPPGGRQHHRQRADQALRPRRTAGRYHPPEVRRLRRPELRRLRAAGHDPRAGGGRQRLLRQGAVRGEADPLPAGRVAVRAPRGDHHRQRLLLRGDRGEAYINGMAGERFCVRNSGVHAVVEAVGDHGCEYMTGGRVVVLGPTGRNFAAGMSGGIAYVLDEAGDFADRCNPEMCDLGPVSDPEELREVREMVERHAGYTGSLTARRLLEDWDAGAGQFVRVMPRDYRRMLEALQDARGRGLTGDDAVMEAFEANKADEARVSGN